MTDLKLYPPPPHLMPSSKHIELAIKLSTAIGIPLASALVATILQNVDLPSPDEAIAKVLSLMDGGEDKHTKETFFMADRLVNLLVIRSQNSASTPFDDQLNGLIAAYRASRNA